VILIDTGGLLSALDESQTWHRECIQALGKARPPYLLSPFVLAELDYLVLRNVGRAAQSSLLEEVARGAYALESFDSHDVARANAIIARYEGLDIGLADASIVVLAERHQVADVLSLDQRHFRAMHIGQIKRFRILPFDA